MHCTVEEAKQRLTPQAFMDLLTYWETEPPLRDHLNICLAQNTQAIFNSQLGKGQRALKLDKFIIDYQKALPSRKEVDLKLRTILGGLAKKGK